ncbi:pyrroline-5-carboxylate reductase [Sulfitobacter sp. D7]|uniref:pyrroline-5-carboxylate reductase n=1 Tax=Sulfitobacter sp. D7 TaxID=1968541 RepID=UPI000E773A63|nr:pyrroline-5-carboxylate reductase [Sulfitobacter sp. D7]AYE88312.1 pyrroline-5-carboxylate reductase [Sulfitobacter sp. D7]
MNSTKTILFVGCGNMGAATLTRALQALPDHHYIALDPQTERAKSLLPQDAKVTFAAAAEELDGIEPDLTIISVKPQQFGSLPAPVLVHIARGVAVSIMPGTSVAAISDILGTQRIARVMPNLAATVGQSMSVGFVRRDTLSDTDTGLISALFDCVGQFARIENEDDIDLATAVAGSGPGYLFAFAQYLVDAAVAQGMPPELAEKMVRQTLLGAAVLLSEDSRTSKQLKEAMRSPGGTTEAGLNHLEAPSAFPRTLQDAVKAAHARAREMAGES